jgi:pyocin large subunit-like protein
MEKRRIPVFQSEAEEAQWWYDHREEIGADLVAAMREGRNGIGTLGRAKLRAEAQAKAEAEAQAASRAA